MLLIKHYYLYNFYLIMIFNNYQIHHHYYLFGDNIGFVFSEITLIIGIFFLKLINKYCKI